MGNSSIYLYLERREPTNAGGNVGQLLFGDVSQHPQNQAGALALNLEFFADEATKLDPPADWVAMTATVRTTNPPTVPIGTVKIDHLQRPPFPPVPLNRRSEVQWEWQLLPSDVEQVERVRAAGDPSAPIWLAIEVRAILNTPEGVRGVNGNGQITIELSLWQRLLAQLNYTTSPSGLVALSNSVYADTSWREAERRLETARKHLRRGETYPALEACLSQLEAFATAPYRDASWKEQLASLPDQKAVGVAGWFAGLGDYLNKVGHHRDRGGREPAGDLAVMPADQWEAELAVASTQLAITYLLRQRGN